MKLSRKHLRKMILNEIRRNILEASVMQTKRSFDAFGYAEDLHDAMKGGLTGLGTDEKKIGDVFNEISTFDEPLEKLQLVAEMYKEDYKRKLIDDLRGELSKSDLDKFVEQQLPGAIKELEKEYVYVDKVEYEPKGPDYSGTPHKGPHFGTKTAKEAL